MHGLAKPEVQTQRAKQIPEWETDGKHDGAWKTVRDVQAGLFKCHYLLRSLEKQLMLTEFTISCIFASIVTTVTTDYLQIWNKM